MRMLLASLLFTAACSSAYADHAAVQVGPRIALAVSPDKVRAPYDVQVITESGETAPTYAFKGRYYVQGNDSEHYTIRVTNPTGNRVEAVVSVDGLDVVDGEDGDLNKRGYIVPAYGEVRIEGFRTSLADVASFRFSSVDNSYAGKKGKSRNVGVIAVAIFEEHAPPPEQQIIVPEVTRRPTYHWTDDMDGEASVDAGPAPRDRGSSTGGRVAQHNKQAEKKTAAADRAEAKPSRPAPPPPAAPGGVVGGGGRGAPATATAPAPRRQMEEDFGGDEGYYQPDPTPAPRTNRPGLGTEFGESRYSAASYTKFVRAANRPIAIAELRYNDVTGLVALGIPVQPAPDEGEIMLRETADPFPGDNRFSRPPGR
ncbi:MAG TPA: hypothetical protein VFV99_02440 [Kofleriaceae bacterium]|nr:hypothetical protein [Kofleriaceae bacterium]